MSGLHYPAASTRRPESSCSRCGKPVSPGARHCRSCYLQTTTLPENELKARSALSQRRRRAEYLGLLDQLGERSRKDWQRHLKELRVRANQPRSLRGEDYRHFWLNHPWLSRAEVLELAHALAGTDIPVAPLAVAA